MSGFSFDFNAIEDLSELCAQMHELLDASFSDAALANAPRLAHAAALMVLAEFLEKTGGSKRVSTMVAEVADGLVDLERGTVRPLFVPTPRGHRPPDPSDMKRARRQIAIALDVFMKAGFTRSEASIAVTNRRKIDNLLGDKSRDANKALLSWHDSLQSDDGFLEIIAEIARRLDGRTSNERIRYAEALLAMPEWGRSSRPGKGSD